MQAAHPENSFYFLYKPKTISEHRRYDLFNNEIMLTEVVAQIPRLRRFHCLPQALKGSQARVGTSTRLRTTHRKSVSQRAPCQHAMRELHTVAHHLTSKEGALTEARLHRHVQQSLGKFPIKAWSMPFEASCPFNATTSSYNRRRTALCKTVQPSNGVVPPTMVGLISKKRASSWQQALKIT